MKFEDIDVYWKENRLLIVAIGQLMNLFPRLTPQEILDNLEAVEVGRWDLLHMTEPREAEVK